jgi:hypothetical protein
MVKIPDWEIALIRYIQAEMGKPFEWRVRDCNTFAVGCIEAMIGYPLALPDLTYSDARSAFRFAQVHSLRDILVEQLAAYPVSSRFQQRGDIAFALHRGFDCAHVVLGRHCAFPDRRAGVSLGITAELPPDTVYLRF